ncbi:phosphopantetheine-binding protein [Clostridium sp.]|uniref:phosphopantetheine-binding protein n=1 Tax=Clostridium sp. TaxID=1506 RepID=UPI0035A049E5
MPDIQVVSKVYKIEENGQIYKSRYKVINFTDNFNVLAVSPELHEFDEDKMSYYVAEDEIIDDAQKREYIVKKFIFELIEEIEYGGLIVDPTNEKIISFWKDYISDFSVDDQMDSLVKEHTLNKGLSIKKQLFRDIIKDNHNKNSLLLDKDLSPEVLGLKSEGTQVLLNKMIEEICNCSKKGIDVAIIQSGQGHMVDYLKSKLDNLKNITLFDSSISMLNQSREKYGEDGFLYELYNYDFLDETHVGNYDHVVIINTIHQFEHPQEVIRYANIMLKKGGRLHLIDFTKTDAVSILVAIFFQERYLNVENEIRHMFFYKTGYLKQIVGKYFKSKKITSLKNNDAYYIISENVEDYKNIVNEMIKALNLKIQKVIILPKKLDINGKNLYFEKLKKFILEGNNEIRSKQSFVENDKFYIENILKAIWKENLEIDTLSDESNYFKLGGNSLSATKMVVEINKQLNCKINLKEIFENPSFKALLNLIQEKQLNPEVIEGEI